MCSVFSTPVKNGGNHSFCRLCLSHYLLTTRRALATRECDFPGRGAVRGESRAGGAVPTRPAGNCRQSGRTTTGNG